MVWQQRYAEQSTGPGRDTAATESFRAEVRRFLDRHLTDELRAAGRATVGTHSAIAASRAWHQRLHARGWIAPAWPVEHGGTGWSPVERLIFDRECAVNDAPVLFAGGLRNVGPLLIAAGTAEQQRRFLPRILDGSHLWCQGYSEPGAGSDLAALRTAARRDGDDYVIDGRKIWTTGADLANWMFALVRTSGAGKPQQGITFLLIDMASPGITVRPVQTLSGEAEFNEVVFEGVRVPVVNRVGDQDAGWQVAKTLMYYARSSNTTCGLLRRSLRRVEVLLEQAEADLPRAVRRAFSEAQMQLDALERVEFAAAERQAATDSAEFRASTMKLLATELHQRITQLALEVAGPAAQEQWVPGATGESPAVLASAKYLGTRAATIYSGTSEVHRNILARHLLA